MKKITAFEWANNLIEAKDLYEGRTNIGLNKRIQNKYSEKSVDSVSNSIGEMDPDEFASRLIYLLENTKGLKASGTSIEKDDYDLTNKYQIDIILHSDRDNTVGVYFLIPTEKEKNEPHLVGYFGMCLFDDLFGTTKPGRLDEWDIDINDKDSTIIPVERTKYTMYACCGTMYKTNALYLDAAIKRLKYWKKKASDGDFSPWR